MPEQISNSQHVYPIAFLYETDLKGTHLSLKETTSEYLRERTKIMKEFTVELTKAGLPKAVADYIDLSGVIEAFGGIIDDFYQWAELTNTPIQTYVDMAVRKDSLFIRIGESEEPLMMIDDKTILMFSNGGRNVPEHIRSIRSEEFAEKRGDIFDVLHKAATMKRKKGTPANA
ncbi:MAG: hypothetical protein HGA67_01055 [Candidatus Yonathbacteria bacterium]|nr:hypothetical protein [Candidatus Yonathbacteria bacterium]